MIGLENRILQSERLTYRLLVVSDKEALYEILSDKSVTEPMGFMPAGSNAKFEVFFTELIRYNTGIAILRGEVLIGYIHVNKYVSDLPDYSGKKCVSTGFVIGKKYQNQGYATETLETVTAYLKRTYHIVNLHNTASCVHSVYFLSNIYILGFAHICSWYRISFFYMRWFTKRLLWIYICGIKFLSNTGLAINCIDILIDFCSKLCII